MSRPLRYVRLPQDAFRLMKLSLDSSGGVSCSLTVHTFEKPPTYVALSYVWGEQRGMRDLYCMIDETLGRSGHVTISAALYAALVALHQHSLPLWVDAICINQHEDPIEKNDQVTKMHKIYQNATQVIAWIGAEQGHSNLAMDVLAWLADPAMDHKALTAWPLLLQTPTWVSPQNLRALRRVLDTNVEVELRDAAFSQLELPHTNHLLWQGFADVFYRSWFSRLWTFEEVMLNIQNTVVRCGDRMVPWPAFYRLGMALSHTQLLYNPNVHAPPQFQPQGMHSFTRLRSYMFPPENGIWFWLYVLEGRYKTVSKKVDRIYALRALADDQLRAMIPVDYKLEDTFWLVFIRAAKAIMRRFSLHIIFAQTESTERAPELPSWCPDFRFPPLSATYGAHGRAGVGPPRILRDDPTNENLLIVGGIAVDTIAEVVREFEWYWPEHDYSSIWGPGGDASRIARWMDRCRGLVRNIYPSEQEAHTAWAQTLLGDVPGLNAEQYPPNDIEGLDLLYRRLRENERNIRREDSALSSANFRTMQPVLTYLGKLWRHKVFFRTSTNRLGFSSIAVKEEDQIALLYGESHVYVLRSVAEQGSHRFIAPAYVRGLMLGEAIKSLSSEDQTHTITVF